MESKPQESPPDAHPVPVYVLPYADRENEISLIDLWRMIAARKKLILMSLLAAIVLASVYVYLAEPVYRAEAQLLPPQQQDIQALIIDHGGQEDLGIKRYTPDLVYKAFLRNFKSRGLRREFFDANDLAGYYLGGQLRDANIDRIFSEKFNDDLRIQADRQDASFVTASFGDRDPGLAAQRLNQFIAFANERTVRQLFDDVNAVIQAKIEQTRQQLVTKLELAAQRRHDRILNLREALRIAKALGIKSASSLAVLASREKAAIEVNIAQAPLYMRGAKALEAEIAVLESRKSDEPFTSGIRDLQERLSLLEAVSIDRSRLSAVKVDAAARPPYRAEKPRKKLVFVLAAVLGLMAGISLVFVAEFRSKASAQSNRQAM